MLSFASSFHWFSDGVICACCVWADAISIFRYMHGLGYTVNSLKTSTTVRRPPLYKTHCHGWLVPSSRISHVCMQLNSFYASTIQQGGQLELFTVARVSTLERVRCAIVIGAERGGKGRASRTSRLNSISTSPSPHYTYHAD